MPSTVAITTTPEKNSKEEGDLTPPDERSRMTFTAHLGELRKRMIWSFGVLAITGVLCYAVFSDLIIEIISYPLNNLQQTDPPGPDTEAEGVAAEDNTVQYGEVTWTTLNPLEPILVKLKISGLAALFFTSPFLLYQIRAFIFPGLTARERRGATIMLSGCIGLGFAGAAIAYWGVFPQVLPYLVKFAPDFVEVQLRLNETLSLILKGILGFAIAFQFPMIVLVLVYLGIMTPASLKSYRKIVIVGIFVAGALLTPPDPVSLIMISIPLVLLYEMSIWLSYIVIRRKKAAEDR